MKRLSLSVLFIALSMPMLPVQSFADPAGFAAKCAELGAKAQAESKPSIPGEGDANWFFLTRELLHLSTGEFWTRNWAETAANQQDPVPFLLSFNQLLKAKGVELLLVPVPAKASLYPDKVAKPFQPGDVTAAKPFLDQLQAAGLQVLDLEPIFRAEREAGQPMFCAQDAHFTPYACQVTAKQIVDRIHTQDWFKAAARQPIVRGPAEKLKIVGDQVPEEMRAQLSEEISVQYCGLEQGGKIVPVEPSDASPIILLGDSHTLVFQEGAARGMHCQGAGLLDQLQMECGFPVSLIGVRGSGSKAARVQLYRKAAAAPDFWTGKKLVVWCFSIREFTQSVDKLLDVPIEKK